MMAFMVAVIISSSRSWPSTTRAIACLIDIVKDLLVGDKQGA
jgi:hypothetical protein